MEDEKKFETDFDVEMGDGGSLKVIAKISKDGAFGADISLSIDLMDVLKKLADKTETEWDNRLLPIVEKILKNVTKD